MIKYIYWGAAFYIRTVQGHQIEEHPGSPHSSRSARASAGTALEALTRRLLARESSV